MSRLASLSPAAIRAMYSPDADDTLIVLLTLTDGGLSAPLRMADGYTQRLSETADDVTYGVVSRANNYQFVPFSISLPTEEQDAAPRAQVSISDLTQEIMPEIRTLTGPPTVLIELVLSATPDTVEASFPGLLLGGVSYNAEAITGELAVESYGVEPYPAHTFTPSVVPGMF